MKKILKIFLLAVIAFLVIIQFFPQGVSTPCWRSGKRPRLACRR
ncbi:MAG: hypothetical protein R6W71_09890 [Bacteroidales bacterium]